MIVSPSAWIREKLEENSFNKLKVYALYDVFIKESDSMLGLDSFKREVRRQYNDMMDNWEFDFDPEQVVKREASRQAELDKTSHFRKVNRESFRIFNILEERYNEYVELLKTIKLPDIGIPKSIKNKNDNNIALIQLSDLHCNENIVPNESFSNEYNFHVLSKRLKKFITKSMSIIDSQGIKKCYLFLTGDLISSNRHWAQQMAQGTSLVRASLLLTHVLSQVIVELLSKYEVHIASVVGNESRLNSPSVECEFGTTDILTSENWDYLIFQNLRIMLSGRYKHLFFEETKNNIQSIVTLNNGFNALILHGHQLRGQDVSKQLAKLMQNYLYKGIPVHGIFLGHIHQASIGDLASRSSSLSGGNAYSNNDLLFCSRASQNLYIINKDLSYDGIKIDLQNTDDVDKGYEITEELERYCIT